MSIYHGEITTKVWPSLIQAQFDPVNLMKIINFVPMKMAKGSRREQPPETEWRLEDKADTNVMLLHIFVLYLNS